MTKLNPLVTGASASLRALILVYLALVYTKHKRQGTCMTRLRETELVADALEYNDGTLRHVKASNLVMLYLHMHLRSIHCVRRVFNALQLYSIALTQLIVYVECLMHYSHTAAASHTYTNMHGRIHQHPRQRC